MHRCKLNVLDAATISAFFAEIGRVDVLFNCAGVVQNGTVLDASEADLDFAYDINVNAMCARSKLLCQECWNGAEAASSTCRLSLRA